MSGVGVQPRATVNSVVLQCEELSVQQGKCYNPPAPLHVLLIHELTCQLFSKVERV